MKTTSFALFYKHVTFAQGTINVEADVYPPVGLVPVPVSEIPVPAVPAVVYFHGGGLTVGNRQSWFPTWLHKRAVTAGYAFISADYQLLPPATGHEIAQDIQDLLKVLIRTRFGECEKSGKDTVGPDEGTHAVTVAFRIDPNAIAVAGSSAGGLCAYLAAMNCVLPKPKAVLSIYGMGGNFFTPHYLSPKTKPFLRGREILDPCQYADYLHPHHIPKLKSSTEPASTPGLSSLLPVSDSPLAYHDNTYHIPGFPANPRMLLSRLYLQLGVFLDYYTGAHENGGVSIALREALGLDDRIEKAADSSFGVPSNSQESLDRMRSLVPPQHHKLIPQFNVTEDWPPTMFVHGTDDTAVPIGESRDLGQMLKACGVDVIMREVEGKEHSFDYEPGAEEMFGEVFDAVGEFLAKHIGRTVSEGMKVEK